jgi:hypothetical protein
MRKWRKGMGTAALAPWWPSVYLVRGIDVGARVREVLDRSQVLFDDREVMWSKPLRDGRGQLWADQVWSGRRG